MKLHLHACLGLCMAVSACDKPKSSHAPAGENSTPPSVTRTERPPLNPGKDARAAFTSAGQIESPADRETAIEKVAWDALEADPDLAREAMEKLTPDSAGRIRLIQQLAVRMAEKNVNEALTWAIARGTDQERAAAVGHVALVLSDSQPDRAAGLLSEFGIAGRSFDVVTVQVLNRWAAQSPADAAAWVSIFPPGKAREAGIQAVIPKWVESDAEAAFSWMATVEDESIRKESTKAMAKALLLQPANVRDEWLGHADPKLRGEIDARLDAGTP